MPRELPRAPEPSAPERASLHATTIIIRARDLDTDEAEITRIEAVAPDDPDAQRIQLIETVASLRPTAEFRSFADSVASFLDRQHLIVAHYEEPPIHVRRASPRQPHVQERLFGD